MFTFYFLNLWNNFIVRLFLKSFKAILALFIQANSGLSNFRRQDGNFALVSTYRARRQVQIFTILSKSDVRGEGGNLYFIV